MNEILMNLGTILQFNDTWEPAIGGGLCLGGMCLLWIVPLVIWLLIGYYMYKDAKKRDENAVLWLIVGLVAGLIGLIIWLVVRPSMDEVRRKRQQQQYQQPPQQQYQQQPPQQQQQPPQQQQQAPSCPDCGQSMRWIGQYNRWYCDNCQEYK